MITKVNFSFFIILSLVYFQNCESMDHIWVFIDPLQCLGNRWEQAWLEKHDYDYDSYPTSESERLAILEEHYQNQGIEIYDIEHEWILETVCGACSCLKGDRIHCLIDESDVEQMSDWGFTEE